MTISVTKPDVPEKPQDSEVVLSVQGVSKKFCRDLKKSLFYGIQDITSELLGVREKSDKLRKKEFWALKDVSFELRRGEALGLVGKNGSGKSTLLRIIAGLIRPDTGSVEVKGRLAPLIALGAGFNPILTGRENIYANMSILGLSKQEIDERFDAVVDFAEIGDAIDAPVQSYSSGMRARLGFASAIHTEPDILLIDEVLAVGDIKFRAKCYRKLAELQERGTSFILVSHNPQSILQVCHLAIYLLNGKLIIAGDTNEVTSRYEQDLFLGSKSNDDMGVMYLPEKREGETFGLDIVSLYFSDYDGNPLKSLVSGEPVCLCLACKAHKYFENVSLYVKIVELGNECGTVLNLNSMNDESPFAIGQGEHKIKLKMPYLGLATGLYTMNIKLKQESLYTLDFVESFRFTVEANGKMSMCRFYQPRSWEISS